MMLIRSLADITMEPSWVVAWLARHRHLTAQGFRSGSTRRARIGDFYLATTGDLHLGTSGDFLMATDSSHY